MSRSWWKEAIIYQIYPRSFKDSNGDGIGDLGGIIEKLDYIESLGVNVIWLNPIYDSPNDDNGYDISNYRSIHPEFGTMEQFDQLLEELHRRRIKLLMDLVVNHSSDEHPWFVESSRPEHNEYHDYYFWKEGRNGGPPNNWPSFFGGPAWTYHKQKGLWYLHLFSRKQPDLNWENAAVREEVKEILRFWLDKGIDGFRMDVIPCISKQLDFPDADLSNFHHVIENLYSNGPRVHEFLQELHQDVLSHYDIMTVGEGPGITKEKANLYVGEDRDELQMIFHLEHMALDHGPGGRLDRAPFDFRRFKHLWAEWDEAMADRGWLSVFLDNHDFPRMVSRFADDQEHRSASAKMLGVLIMTMRGTPCLYFGSEIGMTNVQFSSIDDYRDVETLNFYRLFLEEGRSEDEIMSLIHTQGRDNVRTPMQWSDTQEAGFTTGKPWINVNPRYAEINVEAEENNPDSILTFYRKLIQFRKDHPTLTYGSFELLLADHPHLMVYDRKDDRQHYRIVLNFGYDQQSHDLAMGSFQLSVANLPGGTSLLRPWEAQIWSKKL